MFHFVDIILFCALLGLSALLYINAGMNWGLGLRILAGFSLLLTMSFQNCAPVTPGGGLQLGSTGCPSGQFVNSYGQCQYTTYNMGFFVTITAPTGTGSYSLSNGLNVQGSCVQESSPVSIFVRIADSSNNTIQQASTTCLSGGTGTYSLFFQPQNGRIVPSAGVYTVQAAAQSSVTGKVAYSSSVTIVFNAGMSSPIITSPALVGANSSTPTAEVIIDFTTGTHLTISGVCDSQYTDHLLLRRYGLGPMSSTSPMDVSVGYCMSGQSQGTFSFIDGDVPNQAAGYDNWQYEVLAFNTPGNAGTSVSSGRMNIFVRPKSKGLNSDDTFRVLYAASSLMGYLDYRDHVLTPSTASSDTTFLSLLDFTSSNYANFGIFDAACALQARYAADGAKFGNAATQTVCTNVFGSSMDSNGNCVLDANSYTRLWNEVIQNDSSFLIPRNAPVLQISTNHCPAQ